MADKGGVSTVQIIAGSVGALGAAWVGSRFGLVGTVAGAGVLSVVSSGGTTLAQRSLERTNRTLSARIKARQQQDAQSHPEDTDTEVMRPVTVEDLTQARMARENLPRRRLSWRWALIATAAVFAIALGLVTLLEAGLGHPLSGGNEGTTLSGFVGAATSHPQAPAAPETTTHEVPTTSASVPSLTPSSVPPDTEPSFPDSSVQQSPQPSFSFAPTTTPQTTIAPAPTLAPIPTIGETP